MGRKEKEVVVRLSEADLRAVGYIREYFGDNGKEKGEESEEKGEEV